MTLQHLEQALLECDRGLVPIQARQKQDAFLYKKKWYPIKPVGIRAFEIARERPPTNTHEMTMRLAEVIPYFRFEEVNFADRVPVSIDENELLKEVRLLHQALTNLLT